jgi:DNA polymerase I-like protein with 3'-5' exonuclease and polymerase domains
MRYFISNTDYCSEEFINISVERSLVLLEPKEIIGLDTETRGFFPQIDELCLLQLGDEQDQFVIDCTTIDITKYKAYIESRKLIFIHNAKFDLRFLYHFGIFPTENIWDTFLMERLINIGDITHRASLAACVDRYLNHRLKKEDRGLLHRVGIYDTRVLVYSSEDTKYLIPVYEAQLRQIKEKNLENVADLENKFVPTLSYIEYCGFGINTEMWAKKNKYDLEDLTKKKELLDKYYLRNETIGNSRQLSLFDICSINWDSSQQVIPIMESLGVEVNIIDKKTGKPKKSIENKLLEPQSHLSPLIGYYLDYKAAKKLVSTYGDKFLKQLSKFKDSRLRTNFNQIINSGRLSSGSDKEDVDETDIHNTNFQNIPRVPDKKNRTREIYERECFTPAEGNVFVVSDYSQQEQVIIANTSEDDQLLAFFRGDDSDMHIYVARKIYPELKDLESSDIKANHSDKRTIAKSAGFAINKIV